MVKIRYADDFWAHVKKTDSCWLWLGSANELGYGQVFLGYKLHRAHRVAYEMVVGPIPKGMTLDHLCRTRACVKPDHLEPISQRDNVLRGQGITAQKARQTHCKRGHPFDLFNTYWNRRGGRICRICSNAHSLRYYYFRRAKKEGRLKEVHDGQGQV